MALTREQTVALAKREIGTNEYPPGSNRQKYGVWYGFNGVPWCAIFLSWVLAHAGNSSGYRFASTAASVSWARQRGRLINLNSVLPGDVLVKLYSSSSGHTGMATARPPGDSRQDTVDGNTSDASDRDGGEVRDRNRAQSYWHYAIRLDYPSTAPTLAPALNLYVPPIGGLVIYNPPLDPVAPIVASLNDPIAGGAWGLQRDGAIITFGSSRYLGGANGKNYFVGRQAHHLEPAPDGRYVIVATSGEKYGPSF